MIVEQYYLSEGTGLMKCCKKTGLTIDEIEEMVGRFASHSCRAGRLRGEFLVYADEAMEIRHQFKKTRYWYKEAQIELSMDEMQRL